MSELICSFKQRVNEKEFRFAEHIVGSQLILLFSSYLFLRFENRLLPVLFLELSIAYSLIIVLRVILVMPRSLLFAAGIVLVALAPIVTYGYLKGDILHFGSAYSVDFQQYLSVAYSLISHGLPFSNPYWPEQQGFYHYGFMLPLASIIKLIGIYSIGFYDLSYALVSYIAATTIILLILIKLLFFDNEKNWLIALLVAFFTCSYKGLYGGISAVLEGGELSGYDTSIGFKTLQNDIMFGSHYLYSSIFLLFVLAVVSRRKVVHFGLLESILIGSIAFVSPLLNGFSPVILAAIAGSFVLVKHGFSLLAALTDKSAWILAVVLALSYLGMMFLDVYAPGLRMVKLDFDPYILVLVMFGILVNYAVLVFFLIIGKSEADDLQKISLIAIVIIVFCIWLLTIDNDLEGRFSISRRLGTFIMLFLMINIRSVKFNLLQAVVVIPAFFTFLGQNYYFFNSHNYPDRTIGISRALFDIGGPYRLDDAAYKASYMYRFNFDMITRGFSVEYPNSSGYRQYSPIQVTRNPENITSDEVIEITFHKNIFLPKEGLQKSPN